MIDRELLRERLVSAYDYLKKKGLVHSKSDLARAIGMRVNNLNDAFGLRGNYMNESLLKRVADTYPDVLNRDWLLTGEGKMETVDKSMKPHFPAKVSAGFLTGIADSVMEKDVEYQPRIPRLPHYDFTIDVEGRSMEPSYFDTDIVACKWLDDSNEIVPGRAYVIATQDGAILKRIISETKSSIRLLSDNPDYQPYNIDKSGVIRIARVVGSVHTNPEVEDKVRQSFMEHYLRLLQKTAVQGENDNHHNLESIAPNT